MRIGCEPGGSGAARVVTHRTLAGLVIVLVALLSWASGVSGAPVTQEDQRAERLTFSTGRSVTCLSSAPLREPQPRVEVAIIVVHGAARDDESAFSRE